MITLAKVLSTSIVKKLREIKVFEFGAKTALESAPFGDDSNPPKDTVAIFGKSSETGESVVVGYLNKNRLADVGEKRIYSVDGAGSVAISLHLKKDGTMELGGGTHNAVKFQPLDTAWTAQVNDINTELAKIAAAINAIVPASYTPLPLAGTITAAKSDEIKLK